MRTAVFFSTLILAITTSIAPVVAQQAPPLQAPKTIGETQFGLGILKALPDAVQKAWKEQIVPLWTALWNWVKNIWDTYIFSWLQGIWERILGVFGEKIEKWRPAVEEEFQQEKEQLKQEIEGKIPEPGKTLWERIKGFFPGQ